MRKFNFMALVVAGAILSPLPQSQAQSLLQGESLVRFRAIDPVVTGAIAAPAPKVATPAELPGPASILRHLPNNAQGMRLGGEISTSEWPVYLTRAQAGQPVKFQLGYLSAVSNLPEASTLSIQINDVVIGEIRIDAPHKVKVLSFDVPADLLQAGFNSLRLVASQRHRVDCSLSATYELWTQIDATQTGFLFAANDQGVTSLEDVPALPPSPQGGLPMRVILPGATNASAINQMMRMVELVALRGRFEQPLVEVGSSLADGAGVNLAIGLNENLVHFGGLEQLPPPSGPVLQFLPANAARRATIVASGRTYAEVEAALDQFAVIATSQGSPQGLRAAKAFPGYKVQGGSSIKLRDLGVISQEFNGHLFHASLNIVMPSDFYPANYAKFSLDLAGGYAPGLANGAQIVVSINSKIAVGSPLSKSGGEIFKARMIDLPLGMLRPGLNKLDIDAHLPRADDATCDQTGAATAQKRFLLLDETELVLPNIARVALSPNLAITANGAFPYAGSLLNSHLYIPSPDSDTIAAAATLVARMALSAATPLEFRLTTTSPPLGDGSTLVVAAASALSPQALAMAGLDGERLAQLWKPRVFQPRSAEESQALTKYEALNQARVALQRNFPAECRLRDAKTRTRLPAAGSAPPAAVPRVVNARQKPASLADEWDRKVNGETGWFSWVAPGKWLDGSVTLASGAWDWVTAEVLWGRNQLTSSVSGERENIVDDNANLLLSQKNHGSAGEGIWTVVTAASPAELKQNIFCLVDPRVWSQVGGEMAALDASEAKVRTVAVTDPRFITTQPWAYSNIRLIAAGWFSLNRWAFVVVVIGMALVLAMATLVFVKNIGRQS